jgi:hypothetical protein
MQKTLSRLLALAATLLLASSGLGVNSAAFAAAPTNQAVGPVGQTLVVDSARGVEDMQKLKVTGRGYDLNVGIYVTFCVIPSKGKRPEICGPFDVTGQNNQAVWVSSNPPIYAIPLVKPFDKVTKTAKGKKVSTGSFTVQVPATRMIGTYDCKVVKCAILTRADHTRSDYRKADVIIPVTFK